MILVMKAMMKKIRNQINGLLLLDKPLGLSSNRAIQRVKWILNAEKVGHTGTLDPLATGLLPVCLGEATKFANYLLDGDKEYLATAQLGIITDSGDSEGKLVASNPVDTDLTKIQAALQLFTGAISQIPPMYSALKHNGRPLYEYAREGIEIERKVRQVVIHQLELISYNAELQQITFRAKVSKGTYIRTLAEDIGNELGCGASLIALRRTQTNQFLLADACSLEDLEQIADLSELRLLSPAILCEQLANYTVSHEQYLAIKFGNPVHLNELPDGLSLEQEVKIYANQHFLGVATITERYERLWLTPKRIVSGLAAYDPWL